MKLLIPLKEIMIAPGKRFDPLESSEEEVIERIRKVYGVIAEVMEISIQNDIVYIEFRDATPEKFNEAMKNLEKGVEETGCRFPD